VYVERPYQFDDDGLTAMKVEAWRPTTGTTAGLPDQDLGHPRLFVARGSHSLYMTPGEKDVYPFPDGQESQWCGHYDTPAVTPPGLSEGGGDAGFEDTGAFLGKVLAGLSVGGALGAIAGGVAAAIEGHLPHGSDLDIVGTYDPPDKDEVPAAGAGKTIRPSGVVAAGGGLDDQIWAAKQGLIGPDGRRYDFIVDRATQGWWPNTDNDEKGFRGRWGQQVTSDFLPRRSGPRFPDYAKLFLLALAYRDSHPVFKSGG
jgi:hypothetical protein